jgi:hypothetical protein
VAKSNLAPLAPSLACRLEAVEVPGADGAGVITSRLVIEDECDTPSSALLQPAPSEDRAALEVAQDWLADRLGDGEWHPAGETRDAADKQAGIAPRTLQRALRPLGIEVERQGFPAKGMWRLPSGAKPGGATGGGATRRDCENPIDKPDTETGPSQSRQSAFYGATEVWDYTKRTPQLVSENDEEEAQ